MQVFAPRAMGNSIATGARRSGISIQHTELVTQLSGSNDYTVFNFAFNPGLPNACPWLSAMAGAWEFYEVESLSFQYLPACSTGNSGFVMMGFDYDTQDQPPADMVSFMQLADACGGCVWSSCVLPLRKPDLLRRGRLYVRQGDVPNADLKTFDLGRFYYGVQGNSSEVALLGQITVTYNLRLTIPQPAAPLMTYVSGAVVGGSVTAPFGTTTITPQTRANPVVVRPGVADQIVAFRGGSYFLVILFSGVDMVLGDDFLTISYPTAFPNDGIGTKQWINDSDVSYYMAPVRLTDNSAITAAFDSATSIDNFQFYAFPVPDGLFSFSPP
jgi:hypothetical protein